MSSFVSVVFAGDLAAVCIIGVSVIAGCPQGESWLYLVRKRQIRGRQKRKQRKKISKWSELSVHPIICPLSPLRSLVPNYKEGRERDKNRLCLQKLILLIHWWQTILNWFPSWWASDFYASFSLCKIANNSVKQNTNEAGLYRHSLNTHFTVLYPTYHSAGVLFTTLDKLWSSRLASLL